MVFSCCTGINYDVVPDEPGLFNSLKLKVSYYDREQKQKMKIIFKYDHSDKARLSFLSPLNQLVGALVVENEESTLINFKAARYWQGSFFQLLKKMWQMEFSFTEFKKLVIWGQLPKRPFRDIVFNIKSEKRQNKRKLPILITVKGKKFSLKIKIYGRKIGQGTINFQVDFSKLRKGSLEQVLTKK